MPGAFDALWASAGLGTQVRDGEQEGWEPAASPAMKRTSWETTGALSQLAEKGKGKEVTFTAGASLVGSSWLSHEMGGGATLQLI